MPTDPPNEPTDETITEVVKAAREKFPEASIITIDATWTRIDGLSFGLLIKTPGERLPVGASAESLPALRTKLQGLKDAD